MSYIDDKRYVLEHIDRRTLLEQLAEEAAELSQAALKLIRAEKLSDNPTPANISIASEQLNEELADVLMVADQKGERVLYNDILCKVLTDHTSQADWTPDAAPSLFAKVLIPDKNVIPEWEQPESTNPYNKEDKVTHNGKTWRSTIDGNVWEPGVYGWEEITE